RTRFYRLVFGFWVAAATSWGVPPRAQQAGPYIPPPRPRAHGGAPPPHPVPGISGQGKMRFRLLYTSSSLPKEALKVLVKAHGGFAVDRRAGRNETYFALPGAGILQISADLKTIRLL